MQIFRMSGSSIRTLNLAGAFVCAGALLVAILFMEKYLGLTPCPLCILDRVVILAMALVFLAASLYRPSRIWHRAFAGLNLTLGLAGIVIAGRHVYLQMLPPGRIPDCAPDFRYMLDTFSLLKTLSVTFNTSGTCAETQWTFLGLSIAQQTLLLFVSLFVFCAVLFIRSRSLPA